MAGTLVVIVGATATGKTALAITLARALGGEVINADSRQVYRGMDIGTAKPAPAERAAVPHWLLDVEDPDEPFTLATFLDLANAAIADIRNRDRLPIVGGGTGQYIWALLEGWRVPRVAPDRALRAELEALATARGHEALLAVLQREDPASARTIDARNVRRAIRAIEVTRATGRPFSEWQRKDGVKHAAVVLGLSVERAALYRRIDVRVDAMMTAGLVDEVRRLNASGYGCDLPSMSGIGYRQICEFLGGECGREDAVARIKTETHRLVRKQAAWFRASDARINWLDATAPNLADRALALVSQ